MEKKSILEEIKEKAAQKNSLIVFPEAGLDLRVLEAANRLAKENVLQPVLINENGSVENLLKENGLELESGIALVDSDSTEKSAERTDFLADKLAHKNPTKEELNELSKDPLIIAGWMVATNRADGAVAGSIASTASVIRSALRTIGVSEGENLVSSTFLMELPSGRVLTYADCGVVPYPDAQQLASIAISSGITHQKLTGQDPVLAFLSFSTKGSAKHERVELVTEAMKAAKKRKPEWKIDGELQFDSAFVPEVGERKASGSEVAGKANIMIFPNLDAGNIGYKITQRIGGAKAIGPILQGLNKPFMDLSRGCSPEDIYYAGCIATVLGSDEVQK